MSNDSEHTVLIVDDEEMVAESYELYLRDEYETRIALNGGEALVELTPEVDLVLLDRRMPGISGDEVLEHIEELETDLQVIMVTAVDPEIDIIDMPCEGYLTKPASKDDILDAVEQAFLIDHYEDLISEYYELTKKYATLKSEFSAKELANEQRVEQMEGRIDDLETEIQDTVEEFADGEMSDAFRGLHTVE